MSLLIAGLLMFLGTHSIKIFAPAWRGRQIARSGDKSWRLGYTVASFLGLILIGWGFGQMREVPVLLWAAPRWAPHATALLVLLAFILFAASGVPRNHIKPLVRHPMLAGVVLWAIGHLLANGRLHDLLLFGAFLGWAVVDFASCLQRDRASGVTYPEPIARKTIVCVVAGTVLWGVFVLFLHRWLFGVAPLG